MRLSNGCVHPPPLQTSPRLRMDYAKPGFWIAILAGGAIVAILSAIQQYATSETSSFTFRPVFRDFFLGSFVTASIYMFLPESFDSIISTIPSLTGAGAAGVGAGATEWARAADTIELQTGPARF